MDNGRIVGVVLLLVAGALVFYGLQAGDSFSSGVSELFQGAPSDKSIALLVAGSLVGIFGLAALLRRRAA